MDSDPSGSGRRDPTTPDYHTPPQASTPYSMEDPSSYFVSAQYPQPGYPSGLPQMWSPAQLQQLQAAGRARDERHYITEDQRRELEMRYAMGNQFTGVSYGALIVVPNYSALPAHALPLCQSRHPRIWLTFSTRRLVLTFIPARRCLQTVPRRSTPVHMARAVLIRKFRTCLQATTTQFHFRPICCRLACQPTPIMVAGIFSLCLPNGGR